MPDAGGTPLSRVSIQAGAASLHAPRRGAPGRSKCCAWGKKKAGNPPGVQLESSLFRQRTMFCQRVCETRCLLVEASASCSCCAPPKTRSPVPPTATGGSRDGGRWGRCSSAAVSAAPTTPPPPPPDATTVTSFTAALLLRPTSLEVARPQQPPLLLRTEEGRRKRYKSLGRCPRSPLCPDQYPTQYPSEASPLLVPHTFGTLTAAAQDQRHASPQVVTSRGAKPRPAETGSKERLRS